MTSFDTVAFIPVRGGSKSIKNKNIMPLCGKPLVYWSVLAAVESSKVEKVFVSTDSDEIKNVVESFAKIDSRFDKVQVISRSAQTASDIATSESALIEFCESFEFDKVVFLQATSPLTKGYDIDKAIFKMTSDGADSLVSVVKRHQFLWNTDSTPMNYDPQNRPRRQDWDGYFIENGAFYISKRECILDSKCRISGKISCFEMDQRTLYEVDEPADWEIIEKFLG